MKQYRKEAILFLLQLFMFYIFPLFAGPADAMGMVFLILLATLSFSLVLGALSNKKAKYIYPLVVSVVFIPSVWIYYNTSALVHAVWYLVVSAVGLLIGAVINALLHK